MEDKKIPIEITCPHCGKTTMIICRETRSGWEEGILYGLDCDFEETDCHHNFIGWKYRCHTCNANLELEELEELTSPPTPITEQLKMEGDIDLFEDCWEKDQSQMVEGEEE